ncbi:MAG: response regulator transcription factor, partial [Oscillospiraceae bacterium]
MIYLLEDDDSIRELIIYTLNSQGMQAQGFSRPSGFWTAVRAQVPDLVLLDIMLPEEDGLSILKKLRSSALTGKLPVIMLTAKGSEYDTVLGLDSGADDYIPKPFRMMELLSRIRALLRRSGQSGQVEEYRLGCLYVCPSRHLVQVDGRDV